MAAISASMVKELRERTQAGMNDCKNALVESDGDMEKAVEVILKKGIVKAASRAGRVATEGEVAHVGRRRTASAASSSRSTRRPTSSSRGDDFKGFVKSVVEVASKAPKGADLGAQQVPGHRQDGRRRPGRSSSAKTGENMRRPPLGGARGQGAERLRARVRARGRQARGARPRRGRRTRTRSSRAFVDNVAMQIAAMNPIVVSKDEVTQGARSTSRRRSSPRSCKEEGKPEAAWPKILEGKLAKWFTEVTLLGQDNVWDPPAGTIEKIRLELGKKLGGEVKIHAFVRFALGEGIEKHEGRPRRRSREDDRRLTSARERGASCASAPSASISTRSRTTSRSTGSPSRPARRATARLRRGGRSPAGARARARRSR